MPSLVPDLLAAAVDARPDRVALSEAASGRSLTWAEWDAEVDRVAAGLRAAGMVGGYRVALVLGNRLEFVTGYLGALRARLVAVPVNPRATQDEMARVLADSGARLVLAERATADAVRAAAAGCEPPPRVVVVDAEPGGEEHSFADLLAGARESGRPRRADDPTRPADPESLAVLLYTSGTSGRPRAAMLTHRALLANVEQVAAVDPPMITADDVVLGVLPLFHVYGLGAVLGQVLRQGARLVLVETFDAEGVLDVVDDEAVSVLPVAPPVFTVWRAVEGLRDRLSSVRLVLSGSAPLAAERVEEFSDLASVPVHQGYGLTEAAPVVTSTLCSTHPPAGSVGAALPGIELRLVDERGETPEQGDAGEIWVRGENLFSGYWPDGDGGPDADGWFATGDVGFLDPDGDLFLVDRLKELVIVSGFNVYPVEVEDVVCELDDVVEAAVIGVPDERTGEAVTVHVRPAPGSRLDAEQLADAVREHCATRLARFKQPREVHVVDQLPHTVTGKVAKGALRAVVRRRALELLE